MNEVLFKTAGMGISAGWLILAVIFIRAVFKDMPKRVRCILWGLVAIKLLCPISVKSRLSLIPDSSISWYRAGRIVSYVKTFDGCLIAAKLIWLFGIALLLIFTAAACIKTRSSLREAVNIKDNIFACDKVSVPFVSGLIRPRIYLPSGLSDNVLPHVIAHEKMHISRLDHLWKMVSFAALLVHWYNPLVWTAFLLFGRDMELACDEKIAKCLDDDKRKSYADALLSCSMQQRRVLSYPVAFGRTAVKERVKAVLEHEKPAPFVNVASAIVCLAAVVFLMTSPIRRPGYIKLQTALMPSEPIKVVTFDVRTNENETHKVNITAKQSGPDVFLYFDSDFDDKSAEYTVSFKEPDGQRH